MRNLVEIQRAHTLRGAVAFSSDLKTFVAEMFMSGGHQCTHTEMKNKPKCLQ